jgi:hypothetical protein
MMLKRFLVPLTTLLLFTGLALARDVRLTASPKVPAAAGKVSLDKDSNGNLKIKLETEHLAKPANLSPSATNYVVWIQARDGQPENQGQLKVGDDLKGKFETTTRYQAFDVFVTAEDNPNATTPSGMEVLRGTVQP